MDLKTNILGLQKLTKILRTIQSPKKQLNDYQLSETLRKALNALDEARLDTLACSLSDEEKIVTERINKATDQRRENLLGAARSLSLPHKRFGDYDRIGPLKISYKAKKVKLEIGSEPLAEFDESNGVKVLEKARQALETLEAEPFDREMFFQTIKDAVKLARDHGRADREGWVPIRSVYTYAVLFRHLHFEDFIKKSETNKFRKYSRAQFVYDLARFGAKGWTVNEEVLRSRTPNMATVAAGKTMIIPDLRSMEGSGTQVAVLKIEKAGG